MRRGILIVLAIALVLRLAVVAATAGDTPVGDPADYDRIATWISDAGRFAPTLLADPATASAFRPPAYPVLLGGLYSLFGHELAVARVVGALLGVAFVWLLYLVVARVLDRRLALWSAAIAAVAPFFVWLNGSLLSESLFLPAAFGAVLCVALFRERERWWLAALAGVLVGLAASTRTNGITLALPVVLGTAAGVGWRRLRAPALALVCTGLVLVPWTLRNHHEFGRWLPLGTQGGYTMVGQWNPQSAQLHDIWASPESIPGYGGYFHKPGTDEADLNRILRSLARHYIKDHPKHAVEAVVLNTLRSFDLGPSHAFAATTSYTEMGVPKGQHWMQDAAIYLLTALALLGAAIALARRRRGPLWFWLVPVLIYASGIAWLGNPRHTIPVYAFMTIPAAYALVAIRDRYIHRPRAAIV